VDDLVSPDGWRVDPAAVTWTRGHVRGPHAVPIEILEEHADG